MRADMTPGLDAVRGRWKVTGMEAAVEQRIPVALLAIAVVHAVVIAGAGIVLFFAPTTSNDIWGFELTPFNTRFLGAIYLAALAPYVVLLVVRRWIPARIVMVMAFPFALTVLVVSIAYADRFLWGRPVAWGWFGVYASITLYAGYFLWRFGRAPRPLATSTRSRVARAGLICVALALVIYGAGLLAAPETFAGFWPWPIDAFAGRLYSGIFLALASGATLVAVKPGPLEEATLGLTCAAFGALGPIGLAVVDADVGTVDWSNAGTWAWIGMFAALCVYGLGLGGASLLRERGPPRTAAA
jgi:hypothetical protein